MEHLEVALSLISQGVFSALLASFGGALGYWMLEPAGLDGLAWPERARLTWPARIGSILLAFVLVVFCALIVPMLAGALRGPFQASVAVAFVAAVLPVRFLRRRFERRIHPRPEEADRPSGRLGFLLVMYGHLVGIFALVAAVSWLPLWATPLGLVLAAGLVWGWSRGWGVELALRAGLASPAPPELDRRVRERAREQGIELTSVDVLEYTAANAFALPLGRRVAFTRGALEVLDDEGVMGIADHELGHVGEPRKVILARLAVTMALVPLVGLVPLVAHFGLMGLLVLLGVMVLWLSAGRRLRRRMEERADAHAHEGDPRVYALALEALYRHNRAPAVLGRGPHPDLWDRMQAAGVEPSWGKPAAPTRWGYRLRVLGALLATAGAVLVLRVGLAVPQIFWPESWWMQVLWGGGF